LRVEALGNDFGNESIHVEPTFGGQSLQAFHQVAIQLDRKRHQAQRLVALALFALSTAGLADGPNEAMPGAAILPISFFASYFARSVFFNSFSSSKTPFYAFG